MLHKNQASDAVIETVSAAAIPEQIKSAGVEYVLTVPDATTSQSVLVAVERDGELRHIKVCKEDECFGHLGRTVVLRQEGAAAYSEHGLVDSINAAGDRGEYSLPVCVMAGLSRQGEPDSLAKVIRQLRGPEVTDPPLTPWAQASSHRSASDAAIIGPAIVRAYETSTPVVFLLGRRPQTALA